MRPNPNSHERSQEGTRSEAKAFSAESARAQIMKVMWDRKSSETTVVGYWRSVPLVAVSLAALTGLAFFILVPNLIGFIFGYLAIYSVSFAILAIINYKIAASLNAHFRREAVLRTLLIDFVRRRSIQPPSPEVKGAISKMERINKEASRRERPMNEMIAAMTALPIVGIAFGFAFLWSITTAQAEHDRSWNELLSQLRAEDPKSADEKATGSRKGRKASFAAYFAISLLCFPFLAYWYYEIEKENGLHLQEQWRSEDQLAQSIL